MTHKYRAQPAPIHSVITCPKCGKHCFVSRKAARKVQKTVAPGAQASAYRCGDYWHWGNGGPEIKSGHRSRPELLDHARAQRRTHRRTP